jgi:hypothetical protein
MVWSPGCGLLPVRNTTEAEAVELAKLSPAMPAIRKLFKGLVLMKLLRGCHAPVPSVFVSAFGELHPSTARLEYIGQYICFGIDLLFYSGCCVLKLARVLIGAGLSSGHVGAIKIKNGGATPRSRGFQCYRSFAAGIRKPCCLLVGHRRKSSSPGEVNFAVCPLPRIVNPAIFSSHRHDLFSIKSPFLIDIGAGVFRHGYQTLMSKSALG